MEGRAEVGCDDGGKRGGEAVLEAAREGRPHRATTGGGTEGERRGDVTARGSSTAARARVGGMEAYSMCGGQGREGGVAPNGAPPRPVWW